MRKPSLPKGLSTFVGCPVGYERASFLTGSPYHSNAEKLVGKGLLQCTRIEGKYRYYALTLAGKIKVAKVETFHASKF